jgi:hypothetical protein
MNFQIDASSCNQDKGETQFKIQIIHVFLLFHDFLNQNNKKVPF